MQFMRFLLFPVALVYGAVVWLRNVFYDKGLLKSESFQVPVISVGNLTTGGTGKTPHIEYLIRLISKEARIATLSRGYKRKTTGYLVAGVSTTVNDIGDEPMQFHTKFKEITVAVGEERVPAIHSLLLEPQRPDVILLDDAYQHRAVKPGHSILIIEYDKLMKEDYLLPVGTLREPKRNSKRADTIVISKSPGILVPIERKRLLEFLHLLPHQAVFFSYYQYGDFIRMNSRPGLISMSSKYYLDMRFSILLVTGIANPASITEYLRRQTDKLYTLSFPDHHDFTVSDMEKINVAFSDMTGSNKIIVTTEKDIMRLRKPELEDSLRNLPVFYLPVQVAFHHNEQDKFDQRILNYVRKNHSNHSVHHTANPVHS
jgi:tetraacyldisaccharide 4'-kinase